MIVDKTVKVSKEPADVFGAVVDLVKALKEGQSPLAVVLGELMKLQGLVDEAKKIPGDLQTEPTEVLRAGLLAGADLAALFLK